MDKINYAKLLEEKPWIVGKEQACVISPDFDGFLCALLLSHHLSWQVKGFYDGKTLLIENGTNPKNAVFVDIEIFRKDVKSIGQHLLLPNKNKLPANWNNFNSCISPNNIRNFDAHSDFPCKYPFGTIHFMLSILSEKVHIKYDERVLPALLFADGTFKNIFNYPENSISWLNYLNAPKVEVLQKMFTEDENTLLKLMMMMQNFFDMLREICSPRQGSEKLKLVKVESDGDSLYKIETEERDKTINLLKMLAKQTSWSFVEQNWSWRNLKRYEFDKQALEPTSSFQKRNALLEEHAPLSYAITAGNRLEYTLTVGEEQKRLWE